MRLARTRDETMTAYGAVFDARDGGSVEGTEKRSRFDVRVRPPQLLLAVSVLVVSVMVAHARGRTSALGLCSCECHCDSDGQGPAHAPKTPPKMVAGVLSSAPRRGTVRDVHNPGRCAELAREKNFSAFVYADEGATDVNERNTCAFYDIFYPFNGDSADAHRKTGCAGLELRPEDGCGLVRGWHRTAGQAFGQVTGDARIRGEAADCRAYALAHGFDAWVWINDGHPSVTHRHSCTFFTAFTAMQNDATDSVHISGCADPNASVTDGCQRPGKIPESDGVEGWPEARHRFPRLALGPEKGPGECRKYAKANGFPMFMFVNEKHPEAWARFACGFYLGPDTPQLSDDKYKEWGLVNSNTQFHNLGNDDIHTIYCADETKSPTQGRCL